MFKTRILFAEAIGTFVLVFVGIGVAVTHRAGSNPLDRAIAFGLALAAVTYGLRQISGAHVNPAITAAMWFTRKTDGGLVPSYLIGQFLGAIAAVFFLWVMLQDSNFVVNDLTTPSSLNANTWGSEPSNHWGIGAVVIGEILATALLVLVFLKTTTRKYQAASTGLAIGSAYAALHLFLLPVDGGGMHPAKSLATALFAQQEALEQIWLFLLLPVVGAILGVLFYLALVDEALEDTVLRGTIFEDLLPGDDAPHDDDPVAESDDDVVADDSDEDAGPPSRVPGLFGASAEEATVTGSTTSLTAVDDVADDETSDEADDLKLIYGIGKALEKLLHSEDVSTFKQIANFSQDDVARLSSRLGEFSDRIERDHWVEQAARLHLAKYGQSA